MHILCSMRTRKWLIEEPLALATAHVTLLDSYDQFLHVRWPLMAEHVEVG